MTAFCKTCMYFMCKFCFIFVIISSFIQNVSFLQEGSNAPMHQRYGWSFVSAGVGKSKLQIAWISSKKYWALPPVLTLFTSSRCCKKSTFWFLQPHKYGALRHFLSCFADGQLRRLAKHARGIENRNSCHSCKRIYVELTHFASFLHLGLQMLLSAWKGVDNAGHG